MAKLLISIILLSFQGSKSLEREEIMILVSEFTSPELISNLVRYPHLNISDKSENSILEDLKEFNYLLLVDMTNSSLYSVLINSLSSRLNCAHLSPCDLPATEYRFFLHPSSSFMAKSACKLATHLKMKKIYLMTSNNKEDLLISTEISATCGVLSSFIKYSADISQNNSDQIISKMLKSKGAKAFIIIDSSRSLEVISNSIISKNLNRKGSIFLFLPKTQSFAGIFGSLVLVQKDLQNSSSLISFELKSIDLALRQISSASSKDLLLSLLASKYPSKYLFESLSLINLSPSPQIVGTVTQEINIFSQITFPGNTSTYDPETKLKIKLSIANGTSEIYNMSQNPIFSFWYKGAEHGVSLFNSKLEMPEFEINLQPTDCGLYFYDPVYYDQCLRKYQDFGLAYMAPFWQGAATGTYEALSKRELKVPQISPICQNSELDSTSKYPLFLKLSVSASLYFSSAFLYQRSLGWKFINVLATDDPIYQEQYQDILTYSKMMGITVLNPKDKQVLPWTYKREDFPKYREYFEAAKSNRCRVFCILAYDRGLIWEALYDVGVRQGDFFQMGGSGYLNSLNEDIEPRFIKKRAALVKYSFAIAYREWIGSLGQSLYHDLAKQYHDTSYMCLSYDSFAVIKEAIKFLNSKGEDYENLTSLAKVMRENRITGCLGNVFFDKESNSRGLAEFSIYQLREKDDGTFGYVHVAFMNKLGSVVIIETNQLKWPGSIVPSNIRPANECPFDLYEVRESKQGKLALYVICGYLAILSIIISLHSLRKMSILFPELTEKKQMMFSDMVFLSYFAFQAVQIIYYGPDQSGLKDLLSNLDSLASMDVSRYFNLVFSKFWVLVYCTMTFSFFWSFSCFLITCRWWIPNLLRSKIDYLADYILPIIGHIGFTPVFSMHLSVFQCDKSTGPGLTDSFLNEDCFTSCYRDTHLVVMVISLALCSFYLFFSIKTRPIWETTMPDLNIKTSSRYLYLLSCFQVFVVLLSKTLKPRNQAVHGYVVSSMILSMIFFTFKEKPYNYPRVQVFQILSLSIGFWSVFIGGVFRDYPNLKLWKILFAAGNAIILICGVLSLKKFPQLVAAPPTLDISQLFLFQFRKNWSSQVINFENQKPGEGITQGSLETVQVKTDIRLQTQM